MATKYTQDGDPLIPNTEWVRSLYYQLQRQIVVAEGVLSITAGQNINVDNTTPTAPVVSFEYPTTTHAALLAQVQAETAEDGFYVLTDAGGGSHPMLVGVYNNTVTGLWLQAEKANGDLFLWQIEGYDFLNNSPFITVTDTQRNRFIVDLSVADLYTLFPADDANSANNTMLGGVSDFAGFTGTINNCSFENGCVMLAAGSNAEIIKVKAIGGRRVDVRAVTGGSTVSNIVFIGTSNAETLTVPAAGLSDVSIDLNAGQSNNPVSLTLTANVIDANESADKNWGGIVTVSSAASKLFEIANTDKLPTNFKLKNFQFDADDAGNVNVFITSGVREIQILTGGVLVNLSGDAWADCVKVGTDVYIVQVNDF